MGRRRYRKGKSRKEQLVHNLAGLLLFEGYVIDACSHQLWINYDLKTDSPHFFEEKLPGIVSLAFVLTDMNFFRYWLRPLLDGGSIEHVFLFIIFFFLTLLEYSDWICLCLSLVASPLRTVSLPPLAFFFLILYLIFLFLALMHLVTLAYVLFGRAPSCMAY